ncbi:MAG TPA: rhodanese-like domain-containing protein [Gemmatimonadaceae bacterium]|nr:rhodanese-like domain-containing protein [Gemmatimonadaceae bacterium]
MTEKSYEERVAEAKTRIREVTPAQMIEERRRGADAGTVYLDVREPKEWDQGRLPGAVLLPLGRVAEEVAAVVPRDRRVVIYCARGNRSALAADVMRELGYGDVASMAQGIRGWADAGGEIER